jgi:hypothetical protein
MGQSAVLYWVVQRNTQTGVLITFMSFADYADALRHKAELEDLGDPDEHTTIEVTIETLPIGTLPK